MNEREVNMSKLKTKRKKHYLTAAMLAMLAIATPITLYGSMTTYAQTEDAAEVEVDEGIGYHYQKTGEAIGRAGRQLIKIYGVSMLLQKKKSILQRSHMEAKIQTIPVSLDYFQIMKMYLPSTISCR